MECIRRALVIGLVLIAGIAIQQAPSVGPHQIPEGDKLPLASEVQVEHESRPHQRPSRIKVVTFPIQLLHS